MKRFISDTRGNVANDLRADPRSRHGICRGCGFDYSRATAVREELRLFADQTALNVAHAGNPSSAPAILAKAEDELRGKLRENLEDVQMQGRWLDGAHYQVKISADLRSSLLAGVPGMPKTIAAQSHHRRAPNPADLQGCCRPTCRCSTRKRGDYKPHTTCIATGPLARGRTGGLIRNEFRTQLTAIRR